MSLLCPLSSLSFYSDVDRIVREVPLSQGFSVAGSKFMALRATEQVTARFPHTPPHVPSISFNSSAHSSRQIIVGKCGLQVIGGRACVQQRQSHDRGFSVHGIEKHVVTLGLQGCVLARCVADNTVLLLSDDKVLSPVRPPLTLTPSTQVDISAVVAHVSAQLKL